MAVTIAALSLSLSTPALAQSVTYEIPASELQAVIDAYTKASGVQLIYKVEDLQHARSEGIVGTYEPEEALSRILSGTNLSFKRDSKGALVIYRNEGPAPPEGDTGPAWDGVNKQSAASPVNGSGAPSTLDAIVVLGPGQSKQVQTVSSADIQRATPGSSPLKVLGKLPGVDFQSSDPLGTYEWAQQITVRGFTTDKMGYTLDGVPLGNMQYRNNNGLSIGRALLTENNGAVTLSQGSGGLATASTSNIGGTIEFTSIEPTDESGVDLAQTYGSNNAWRSFVRWNSGLLRSGGKFTASYAHQDSTKWKGWGKQKQDQLNAKFVQPLGDRVTSTTFLDVVDRREDDYMDVSFGILNRLGWKADTISNNFALAEQLAYAYQNGGDVPAPYASAEDTYYNGGGVRQDLFAYQRFDYDLTSDLAGQTTAYFHRDHGIGTYASIYDPTPEAYGGSPISVSTLRYDIVRSGITSKLDFSVGDHTIEAGVWFEDNDFHQFAPMYGLEKGVAPSNFETFYSNPYKVRWNYQFDSKVYQFSLGDTWQLSDALRLNAGFKSVYTQSTARTIQSSTPINGTIKAQDAFLPTVGALFKLNKNNELFVNYTQNMAAFVASASSGPFSTTQAGFDYIRSNLKPETSDTLEAGYRYHAGPAQVTLAAYDVSFRNRLLAVSTSATVVGNQNVLQNVGGVTSRGVEAALNLKLASSWSLYGSWALNRSTYDNDVVVEGAQSVQIKGNDVVDSPRSVGSAQLNYDDGRMWAQLGAHYHGKRHYTYQNDSPVAGATTWDFGMGYRLTGSADAPGVELSLNVSNLLDKRYIASIGTSGFVNTDPAGTYTTLQPAAPRQIFGTVRWHF